jgi:hypothetical protein
MTLADINKDVELLDSYYSEASKLFKKAGHSVVASIYRNAKHTAKENYPETTLRLFDKPVELKNVSLSFGYNKETLPSNYSAIINGVRTTTNAPVRISSRQFPQYL